MIQDIAPHKYHNEYKNAVPKDDDFVLIYEGSQVFLKSGTKEFLTYKEYRTARDRYARDGYARVGYAMDGTAEFLHTGDGQADEGLIYLFSVDETAFFLAEKMPEMFTAEADTLLSGESTEIFRTYEPRHLAFAGITGAHLAQWYRSHRFCGRCGKPMVQDEKERAMRCECGNLVYPVISPAVIVGVRDGNRLLLTKYSPAHGAYKKYALIAGFTEIGESMEDTVRREVMEEVGLKVGKITYYKSQPWAFSGTELMGFYADLDGSDQITLEEDELKEATWFEREDLPPTDGTISLTAEMIETFREAGADEENR